jgi:hypothetical protein
LHTGHLRGLPGGFLRVGEAVIMGLNRLRGMWMSEEDPGQAFLFKDMQSKDTDFEVEIPRRAARAESYAQPAGGHSPQDGRLFNATGEQLRSLLDQCMQLVGKDPEVALRGQSGAWDSWFQEPLLSAIRCSNLGIDLKLRLLAFLALMLPFLDDREQERVRMTISGLSPLWSPTGEILTEQDLIHTQWLVRAIRRSKDIRGQMEGLRRSILNRLPQPCAA